MSDDLNRPDPGPDSDQELEVDMSAFLPEGSSFATDDNVDADADAESEADAASANVEASDPGAPSSVDDWETGGPAPEIPAWARDDLAPAPSMADDSNPTDTPETTSVDQVAPTPDEANRDADPAVSASTADEATTDGGAAVDALVPVAGEADVEAATAVSGPAPVADAGPSVPAAPEVDTTVLTRLEGELADVDAAIAAIDSGDLTRSPLLTELLATDQAPAEDQSHGGRPAEPSDQTQSDHPAP